MTSETETNNGDGILGMVYQDSQTSDTEPISSDSAAGGKHVFQYLYQSTIYYLPLNFFFIL